MNNTVLSTCTIDELIHNIANEVVLRLAPKLDSNKDFSQVEFLNAEEGAKFLKIEKRTLYNKVNLQQIASYKKNGRLYFSREELEDYIRNGKRKTLEEIQEEANHFDNKRR